MNRETVPLSEAQGVIANAIRRMTTDGGDGNFVIVSAGDHFLQFAASNGATSAYCEAVRNDALPPTKHISEERYALLGQLGFADSGGHTSQTLPLTGSTDAEGLAIMTVKAFVDVFGKTESDEVTVEVNLE